MDTTHCFFTHGYWSANLTLPCFLISCVECRDSAFGGQINDVNLMGAFQGMNAGKVDKVGCIEYLDHNSFRISRDGYVHYYVKQNQ